MGRPDKPLSSTLSPIVFGTAVFNHQYNDSPSHLPIFPLLHRALSSGATAAFDTSPYYGPSEVLLGKALAHPTLRAAFPRESYSILTKIGRISGDCFDYSPEWIRRSVRRSLKRLQTTYLDVVYCHDVEFVSEEEAINAVRELRRIRDEDGTVKYVGISGYPIDVLCHLSERILKETGEPLDIVQSYSNYNLQNMRLLNQGLERFKNAGVDVVTNASVVSMGLLRRNGVPISTLGDWHPSPKELRQVVKNASDWLDTKNQRLEVLAIRFALENWLREGASVGVSAPKLSTTTKLGVSVMGVSNLDELEDFIGVWQEVLDDHELHIKDIQTSANAPATAEETSAPKAHVERRKQLDSLVNGVQSIIGKEWLDYAWPSPSDDFQRKPHVIRDEEDYEWENPEGQVPVLQPAVLLDESVQEQIQEQLDIKDAIKVIARPITPSSSSVVSKVQ